MIRPEDLGGDADLARRILVRARSIAPCIDSFADDSEEKKDALAILKGVLAEQPTAGSKRTRSMSRNGTSISFDAAGEIIDADSAASLRSLCGAVALAGLPLGSFPTAHAFENVWPEGAYT